MRLGAGTVAARLAGARELMDPRPYAVGSIVDAFARHPQIGPLLPAMGDGKAQIDELAATIAATPCDVVVTGTPIDLRRIQQVDVPIRHATYELRDMGRPTLAERSNHCRRPRCDRHARQRSTGRLARVAEHGRSVGRTRRRSTSSTPRARV